MNYSPIVIVVFDHGDPSVGIFERVLARIETEYTLGQMADSLIKEELEDSLQYLMEQFSKIYNELADGKLLVYIEDEPIQEKDN